MYETTVGNDYLEISIPRVNHFQTKNNYFLWSQKCTGLEKGIFLTTAFNSI